MRFDYFCDARLEEMAPRACQCSFCIPRGASYVSDPASRLEVRLRDPRMVYAHVHGTGTAKFVHCGLCNELVYVRCEIEGRTYGLIAAQALSHSPPAAPYPVDHDGESMAQRLARRAAHWIPDLVVFDGAQ